MARDRDVAAFAERAEGYEEGWRGRLHHEISDRTMQLALAQVPAPHRVLDVGSGTGYLLRQLAARAPDAVELVGVDAAAEMVRVAEESTPDPRVRFLAGTAEHLPGPDGAFDLVVTTTSFDHWADQEAGLRECARVMAPGGRLVLADQFSPLYLPTLIGSRRGKARTRRRATGLLTRAGFQRAEWHVLYAVIIGAVTASK
ncbi:MAG: class I SAM-dependent methyltransferase [Streptosporangiaceae bacterium]